MFTLFTASNSYALSAPNAKELQSWISKLDPTRIPSWQTRLANVIAFAFFSSLHIGILGILYTTNNQTHAYLVLFIPLLACYLLAINFSTLVSFFLCWITGMLISTLESTIPYLIKYTLSCVHTFVVLYILFNVEVVLSIDWSRVELCPIIIIAFVRRLIY